MRIHGWIWGSTRCSRMIHLLLHVLASLYPILSFPFGANLSLSTVSSAPQQSPSGCEGHSSVLLQRLGRSRSITRWCCNPLLQLPDLSMWLLNALLQKNTMEVFKARLEGVWSKLVQRRVSLPMA